MQNRKNFLFITIIFILFSMFFYGKTGNILIDFSRELYIPYQMNDNSLVKNIFLIYGPIGYIINYFLNLISNNINIFLIEAHIISFSITILFYLILNEFFNKKVSFTFTIFFIALSIFSNSTFSFVVPYSYSTLWGVLGIYIILYSLLKENKKILFLALGLVLGAKIEFFILAFIISIFYLIYKKQSFKKEFLYIFIFPVICLIYFLVQKIALDDIIKNYFYIKEMVSTKSLIYLYQGMGAFFEKKYFIYNLILLLKFTSIGTISYLFYKFKKPTVSYLFFIILICFINTTFALNLIGIVASLYTLYLIQKKNIVLKEFLVFLFALILCSKSFFAINTLSYSNFGYFLMFFYMFMTLQKNINKTWLINVITIFFIFSLIKNIGFYIEHPKEKIKTNVGNLYINKNEKKEFIYTNDFIKNNITKDENFIILPEGQIFNYINKKDWNFYNSTFTPLDFETFKEENLIKDLKEKKTDFIIFYPRNTLDYGYETICYNYGVDFCKYIIDNYTEIKKIESSNKVTIFKIKK